MPPSRAHRPPGGFSLLEVSVALAIAALLAALAYPAYTAQLRKSRRTDAVAALMQLEQAQERWRGTHAAYAAELAAAPPEGLGLRAASAGGHYRLALSGVGARGYTATAAAVPDSPQAHDSGCTWLSVTVADGHARRTPSACWAR